MSNYNKFGFYKNKYNISTLQEYTDFTPTYPNLPTVPNFYALMRGGFVQSNVAVANVNTTLGAVFDGKNDRRNKIQQTMPDGNIAFVSAETLGGGNFQMNVFKYDVNTATISQVSPGKVSQPSNFSGPDTNSEFIGTNCLDYDGNVDIYSTLSSNVNTFYTRLSVDYGTLTSVKTYDGNISNFANVTYPLIGKALALDNKINFLFASQYNAFNAPNDARNVKHNLTTNTFQVTSLQYDNAAANIVVGGNHDIFAVQVPGTGSTAQANIYVVPGKGFLVNGNDPSNIPTTNADRVIIEHDPATNITTRLSPVGANLSVGTYDKDNTLYQGCTLGVDGNVYAFPGEIKKDIMVFDASNNIATQSTFGIFNTNLWANTNGFNSIITRSEPILAPDGHIYVECFGQQEVTFPPSYGNVAFWLNIDTNPTSATYQTGNVTLVDPTDPTYVTDINRRGWAIARDGLIMQQPDTNEVMETLQISGNGGFRQNYYPALLNYTLGHIQ